MSPEGKPIQVNTNALQAAAAQSAVGMSSYLIMLDIIYHFKNCQYFSKILCCKIFTIYPRIKSDFIDILKI